MSPFDTSSYLSTNILTIGISSITPMMYLSLDTIKCVSNANRTQNVYAQCSGVSSPQSSICMFLLIMMIIKVLVAPLSNTTLTTNDLIKLNLPHRLIFQGATFGLSFLLNLYLFVNMEVVEAADSILTITLIVVFLALIPLFLEFFQTIFHSAPTVPHSPYPPNVPSHPPSGEISLSPTDSLSSDLTDGSTMNIFV